MTVDWQIIVDIVFALGGGLGGWILTTMWAEIKSARQDHSDLLEKLPETYARRDDVKEGFRELTATLIRIEGKLDQKQDKTK